MTQREIDEPQDVLNNLGVLSESGWAREPLFIYNEENLWASRRNCTANNTYVIFSNSFLFVFELCDNGRYGVFHVTAVSLLDKHILSKTVIMPQYFGGLKLPASSDAGSIQFRSKNNEFTFIVVDDDTCIIKIDIPQIGHNRRLRGEFVLIKPQDAQSLWTLSVWPQEYSCFTLRRVSPWWSIEGVMQFENTDMPFISGRAWGIFLWNRMTRPRYDIHYQAAACGAQDGRQVSFALGYGTSDSGAGTENAFFVNGILQKLEFVTFQFAPSSMLKPWRISSNNNQLNMTFYPQQSCHRHIFFFIQSERVLQLFGFFSGSVILEDGSTLNFSKITGIIERRHTKN